MSLLAQVYIEGGDVILNVIELWSSAWPDRIVLVQDYVGHTFITEDDRTIVAQPSGMAIALPKRDATGAQNLNFAIDGVRVEATELLRSAIDQGDEVFMTFRRYLFSDLTEPAEKPIHFIVRSFTAQADHVEITAGMFSLIDMRWPRQVFDSVNSPCLKYVQ